MFLNVFNLVSVVLVVGDTLVRVEVAAVADHNPLVVQCVAVVFEARSGKSFYHLLFRNYYNERALYKI